MRVDYHKSGACTVVVLVLMLLSAFGYGVHVQPGCRREVKTVCCSRERKSSGAFASTSAILSLHWKPMIVRAICDLQRVD
jgi:hypothetical protein